MKVTQQLHDLGQSLWLDNIRVWLLPWNGPRNILEMKSVMSDG
jgi:hypothetical protein